MQTSLVCWLFETLVQPLIPRANLFWTVFLLLANGALWTPWGLVPVVSNARVTDWSSRSSPYRHSLERVLLEPRCTNIVCEKRQKMPANILLSQSAVFIWAHVWMPPQQQHLSGSHHPSRAQPEGRDRAEFLLASTKRPPWHLMCWKWPPPLLLKRLFVALVTLKELPARRGCNYGYGWTPSTGSKSPALENRRL